MVRWMCQAGITSLIHSPKSFISWGQDECSIPSYALKVKPIVFSLGSKRGIPIDEVKTSAETLEMGNLTRGSDTPQPQKIGMAVVCGDTICYMLFNTDEGDRFGRD